MPKPHEASLTSSPPVKASCWPQTTSCCTAAWRLPSPHSSSGSGRTRKNASLSLCAPDKENGQEILPVFISCRIVSPSAVTTGYFRMKTPVRTDNGSLQNDTQHATQRFGSPPQQLVPDRESGKILASHAELAQTPDRDGQTARHGSGR